ncbi:hypothetical protein BCV70DRAFT_164898 [Testicularia cyperi]|uniref:Zn(2)-C6 fungal-type domain-containing protein n=1 Tax=Testicularia cyperi TaxID=1882483 RepID=A0A317XM44_9BASI|nr:hypothetical protein BCV70DRAFT_164898 [Testicularia cyperi]
MPSVPQQTPFFASTLENAFLAPEDAALHRQHESVNGESNYLTTFEDPIAEAYIADQTLNEPFYSIAPPGQVYLPDGTLVPETGLPDTKANILTDFNEQKPGIDPLDPFPPTNAYIAQPNSMDPASAILNEAGLSRFAEINDDGTFDLADEAAAVKLRDGSFDAGSSGAGSSSNAANKDGLAPRRRTRRRQNISCDQCRASKRGCDFQLRLDADGNDVGPTTSGGAGEAETAGSSTTGAGDKRKLSDAGQDGEATSAAAAAGGAGGNKLVCSNCQRRGIECTTFFADSVRSSKSAAQTTKDEPASGSVPNGVNNKKRAITDDSSENGMRSKSVSSDAGSPGSLTSSEARTRFIQSFANRAESQTLAVSGPNARFAQRADSLLLTTNRMRLYVHTVEPNANLWLSRACSPLRTDGDLGAYIKSAIGVDALNLSQQLWASWHVDAPSSKKEHQPNLFYLVYGLDHLGGEMGVWGEKPRPPPGAASSSEPDAALNALSSEFNSQLAEMSGLGPGGWRRSKRDLMIDEAVKAAMLAYACQFRLDDETTSSAADAESRKGSDGKIYRDAHDRIATAAWKRARSLILQLAPRRSCRVAYGLFLFGVTAPPPGALAEGGATSGADAAEDAAFAFETASRHLEWFVKRCRDLLRTVDNAVKNPLLSKNAEVQKQRRIAGDLMGLAESLGWFGLLIDTVAHVSQGRRSSMREDSLVDRASGIGSGTGPGLSHGPVPSPHSASSTSPPDRSAEALFAIQDTINLLPSRQAPPGAFPGTSESYMHDELEPDGSFQVDTEMSRRIMERAACARDLIPALLRNPGALTNAIPFDVLIGGGDPESSNGTGAPIININNPGGGLNEQVVLLGVAWGTAVEVYIWRRVGVLHAATETLLSSNNVMQMFILGGGTFVTERVEKLVMNILEAVRLFHSIFDGLIAKALDEFAHLSRQARTMLSFFVIHIHLGVLHFIRLAKRIEQKELEFIQAFNALNLNAGSEAASSTSPMSNGTSPSQQNGTNGNGSASASAAGSFSLSGVFSPTNTNTASMSSSGSPPATAGGPAAQKPLRSKMLDSSVERRLVGRSAALGMARVAALVNAECVKLEEASRLGRMGPKAPPKDGKARKGSFYDPNAASNGSLTLSPIEDSSNAPWRHPYPVMVADALKLSAQQLHDEIWDQLIAVPRNDGELKLLMSNFNVLLDGFNRLLHAVPGLGSYKSTLNDLENARDTASFVATQN